MRRVSKRIWRDSFSIAAIAFWCWHTATELAASPGFAPGHPVSETGALLIMQRGNWSPGKVPPPRLLGVGQTRYYFTTGRKLATGAGIAPAFAPSKGAVLRLDDPAVGKDENGESRMEDGKYLECAACRALLSSILHLPSSPKRCRNRAPLGAP